jgi:hypothetical protein
VPVGCMPVSKADGSQTTDLQRSPPGRNPKALYEDKASGKRDDRPHLVNIVHELTERGVGLKVLTGHGAANDTTTASRWTRWATRTRTSARCVRNWASPGRPSIATSHPPVNSAGADRRC